MNKFHALLGIVVIAVLCVLNTMHYISDATTLWLIIATIVITFA